MTPGHHSRLRVPGRRAHAHRADLCERSTGPVLSAPDRRRIRSRRPRTGTRRMRRCSHEDPTLGGPNRSGDHLGRPICGPATGRFSAETCITPGRSCEKFSKSSEPESAATPSPAPGSACEASSWSRRENRLPRNYLGAEAPFRHLVLTTPAWPLRASRDTPALLARLV
jgi:hypothetical protein